MNLRGVDCERETLAFSEASLLLASLFLVLLESLRIHHEKINSHIKDISKQALLAKRKNRKSLSDVRHFQCYSLHLPVL